MRILVCGGGGFIGHHLARRLKSMGHTVIVADIKWENEYSKDHSYCSDYVFLDLTKEKSWETLDFMYGPFHQVFQLAADMGGAGYVFTGDNDFNIMVNSVSINLHAVNYAIKWGAKIFYSSSACMYPSHNQEDPNNPKCSEESAYPANPDSEYGWEKLFSERLYLSAKRNCNLKIAIGRFHNIFGPEGTYNGGKEKAPAAICRKVSEAKEGDSIEIWGPGNQTRSFLYIDECIDGVLKLMESNVEVPVNIGSEEMISINDLAKMVINISGKNLTVKNIPGPVGVMGRNSDNTLIRSLLGWEPKSYLIDGIKETFKWINSQILTME